jgi:hypothetical protein
MPKTVPKIDEMSKVDSPENHPKNRKVDSPTTIRIGHLRIVHEERIGEDNEAPPAGEEDDEVPPAGEDDEVQPAGGDDDEVQPAGGEDDEVQPLLLLIRGGQRGW